MSNDPSPRFRGPARRGLRGEDMARRERPLDPGSRPLHRFADGLRRLRGAAGDRQPTLDVVLAYVGACGGDPDEWSRRWHRLDAALRAGPAPPPAGEPPAAPVAPAAPAAPAAGPGQPAVAGTPTQPTQPVV